MKDGLCGCGVGDVAFHDPLEGVHDEGGVGYRSEVIEDLRAALLWDGDDCRVFPCLWDSASS